MFGTAANQAAPAYGAVAISDPGIRFTFDFGDLRRAPPSERLHLAPQLERLPGGACPVTPAARPRWLPPLLPVFRAGEPLRVSVLGADAPVWAWRLRSSLAAIFAAAGGRARLQVVEWHDGFAVGAPGFNRVPATPHAVVLAASCDLASPAAASRAISSPDPERCFLAIYGGEPAGVAPIGLDAVRLVRFRVFRRAERAALARGLPPGLTGGPFGRACLGLAEAIGDCYRRLER